MNAVTAMCAITRQVLLIGAETCSALPAAASAPIDGPAPPNEATITCTNPASGASWQITIDYEHATVDSNPASVSDARISWHDAKDGGHYTLDRASGNLTVIVASSTGGYFLHDLCRLKQ
jgi:hypothetical protein